MKALTINQSAGRSTQSTAKLRSFAKSLTSAMFAEQRALAVTAIGATAAFVCAVAEHPHTCAAIVAVTLPWFVSLLAKKEVSHDWL